MPEAISVEVQGMEELQAKLAQVESDLRGDALLQAMRDAVMLVTRDAKRYAPVDTGRLRSSITPEVAQRDTVVEGVVGSNVEYAPYQELGTRYMAGKRFLQRALEENANEIFRLLGLAVEEALQR